MTEQRIAEVFVELADTLVDDFDLVDFLHSLTDRCVELLDIDASGLMLSDDAGQLQLAAGTSTVTKDLELFELESDQGPCLDCFATGAAIANVDLAAEGVPWPSFARAALDIGVLYTTAVPMRLRGTVIGALNLFSTHDRPLSRGALGLAQGLADIATIGLLNQRWMREKVLLSEQLQTALQSRILIEQAKGALSARSGLSVSVAFERMRVHARHTGLPLTTVARNVLDDDLRLEADRE